MQSLSSHSEAARTIVTSLLEAINREDFTAARAFLNLPRFNGHGNSKKERGPDGSKKERATGLYGAIQKPSSGDGDPQRQEFGADCARAWGERSQSAWREEGVLEAAAAGGN